MGTTSDKGSKTKKATLNENIIVDENLNQVLKSICKISIQNGENNIIGTGFFIKIFITDIPYNYLMANAHLITDEIVDSQKEIEIYYDYETKNNSIILNNEEREINEYNTNNLDITIIQILDSDNIDISQAGRSARIAAFSITPSVSAGALVSPSRSPITSSPSTQAPIP